MSKEKMVYVPRNWKVSYVDSTGNEHNDVEIRANAEYRIVADGQAYNVSVAGIRTEEDKNYIVAKVLMYPGTMNVMKKADDVRFDLNTVTEITTIVSNYCKATNSNRNKSSEGENVFTFAFDTSKYSSKYRISVNAGEFVSLAVKDIADPNKKSRSFYGHVIDVDSEKETVKFSRYISNRGVRDVYTQTIPINALLGVYRYELKFTDYEILPKEDSSPETIVEDQNTTEE